MIVWPRFDELLLCYLGRNSFVRSLFDRKRDHHVDDARNFPLLVTYSRRKCDTEGIGFVQCVLTGTYDRLGKLGRHEFIIEK